MNGLREYNLSHKGSLYIKEMLSKEGIWGEIIIKNCTLENGKVITYLPEGKNSKELEDFMHGGKLPRNPNDYVYLTQEDGTQVLMNPKTNLDKYISSVIEGIISIDRNKICIFEDILAKSSDPSIKNLKTPFWFCKDKVFHYKLGGETQEFSVKDILSSAVNAYLTWGAITSFRDESELPEIKGELSEKILRGFAKRVEKIFVSAYDGEGYLIWEKD